LKLGDATLVENEDAGVGIVANVEAQSLAGGGLELKLGNAPFIQNESAGVSIVTFRIA